MFASFCVGHVKGLSSCEAKGMDETWLNNIWVFFINYHVLNFVGKDYIYYIIDFILIIGSILMWFIELITHFYIIDSIRPQMSFDVSPRFLSSSLPTPQSWRTAIALLGYRRLQKTVVNSEVRSAVESTVSDILRIHCTKVNAGLADDTKSLPLHFSFCWFEFFTRVQFSIGTDHIYSKYKDCIFYL